LEAITPCLWLTQREEAAAFYTSIFDNFRIREVTRYGEDGPQPAGSGMTVAFKLDGPKFVALNGGPQFTFDEAISFQVSCRSQEEVDSYWSYRRVPEKAP
jgi:predicted 3-demethylubiquinone-9 3-methyltransferase (glyoxalase superfamily)